MTKDRILTLSSLFTAFLFVAHLADDIAHEFEPGGLGNLIGGTLITVVLLYGTLVLRPRLSGRIIMLLGGLGAFGIGVVHMRGDGIGAVARESGGFFFVATLLLMAAAGIFSVILSAQELWASFKKTPASID